MVLQSLSADLGWRAELRCWADSSAAKATHRSRGLCMIQRIGPARLLAQDAAEEAGLS